jgi:hypothetical protein
MEHQHGDSDERPTRARLIVEEPRPIRRRTPRGTRIGIEVTAVAALIGVGFVAVTTLSGVRKGRTPDPRPDARGAQPGTPSEYIDHVNEAVARARATRTDPTTGGVERTIDSLEEAIRLAPRRADLRYELARTFEETGRLSEAAREFREYLRLSNGGDPTREDRVRAWLWQYAADSTTAPVY